MFNNKKTYAIGVIIIILGILNAINIISTEIFVSLLGILVGGGVITMREAISKLRKREVITKIENQRSK